MIFPLKKKRKTCTILAFSVILEDRELTRVSISCKPPRIVLKWVMHILVCPVYDSTPCILLYTPYTLYNLIPRVSTPCILLHTLYTFITLVYPANSCKPCTPLYTLVPDPVYPCGFIMVCNYDTVIHFGE